MLHRLLLRIQHRLLLLLIQWVEDGLLLLLNALSLQGPLLLSCTLHHRFIPNHPRRKRQLPNLINIHLEIFILVLIVIDGLRSIDEIELRQPPPHQRLVQNLRLLSVESIIHYLQSHFGDRWSILQEICQRTVGLDIDLVELVHDLLPPVTTHEEEWENQAHREHYGQHVATVISLMCLVSHNEERSLVHGHLLSLCFHDLLLVKSRESVEISHCSLLVPCEEIGPVFDSGRHGIGCNSVVGVEVAGSSKASTSKAETCTVVAIVVVMEAVVAAEAVVAVT
jgi:hypothetical protein